MYHTVKQFCCNIDISIKKRCFSLGVIVTVRVAADLVGFTAWSSTREPTEVFTLLETLYRNFDMIAKQRRVYKGMLLVNIDEA